jgi:hypothetical protein
MKKQALLLITLIIIFVILFSFTLVKVQAKIIENSSQSDNEYDYMWTKAICNENYCQDYKIYCKDEKLIKQTPITGATMQIDNDWIDPRPIEHQEKIC